MWQIKATAAELIAVSFRYPDEVLADAVASGEWLAAAKEIAEALGAQLPDGFGLEDLTADAEGVAHAEVADLLHVLRPEATHLFVGVPTPAASPYEGIWRAEQDGVQGLLFVNPHSMDVERFLKSCGLGRPEGTNEPLDHVATEFEFLQYAAALEAGIAQPVEGGIAPDAFPGGSAGAAYATFIEEHPATWIPQFAAAVQEKSRIPFYRAAGQLLEALFPKLA